MTSFSKFPKYLLSLLAVYFFITITVIIAYLHLFTMLKGCSAPAHHTADNQRTDCYFLFCISANAL